MNKKKIKNCFVKGAISPAFIAERIASHATQKNIGAHSIFLGQVRHDQVNDKTVVAIEYTAYEEMASLTFHEIREATFAKYALTCMHIYHSLGRVNAGEISLFVFTSSIHRDMAISACAAVVEEIKKKVPVWGKELLSDETFVWKENRL